MHPQPLILPADGDPQAFPLKLAVMSATMNAHVFQDYLPNAPHIEAQGRTFPVTHHFLEDTYELLSYVLPRDSPAAVRAGRGGAKKKAAIQAAGGASTKAARLLQAGWGDDEDLDESGVNPNFVESGFSDYSEKTLRNLRRVDESATDYDLIEALLCYICT